MSLVKITYLLIAAAITSGCQTATELRNASTAGMPGCDQIKATFGAYDQDRQSVDALKQVAGVTNLNVKGVTEETVAGYYTNVRDAANVALFIQGCKPMQ